MTAGLTFELLFASELRSGYFFGHFGKYPPQKMPSLHFFLVGMEKIILVCQTKKIAFWGLFLPAVLGLGLTGFIFKNLGKNFGIYDFFLAPLLLIVALLLLIFAFLRPKKISFGQQKIIYQYQFLPLRQTFLWADLLRDEQIQIKTWNGVFRQTDCFFRNGKISLNDQEFDNYEAFGKILAQHQKG